MKKVFTYIKLALYWAYYIPLLFVWTVLKCLGRGVVKLGREIKDSWTLQMSTIIDDTIDKLDELDETYE